MRNTLLWLMMLSVAAAGCGTIYDYWPAQFPKDTKDYAGFEPNSWYYPSLGLLRQLREQCITKNITVQSDLAFQMNLDKALYARALDQANINIKAAEAERAQIVGTIQNPGWLLSFLLPAAGALAGRSITQLTHYSESELQTELNKQKTALSGKTENPA
jgi:hypothetical protein